MPAASIHAASFFWLLSLGIATYHYLQLNVRDSSWRIATPMDGSPTGSVTLRDAVPWMVVPSTAVVWK